MRGGVELPRGTNTLGVEELPRGDKKSRVTPKGNGVPMTDEQCQEGDGNYQSTQDTEGSCIDSHREDMLKGRSRQRHRSHRRARQRA